MWTLLFFIFALGLVPETVHADTSNIRPFRIDLSARVPHMLDLVRRTHLPASSLPASRDSFNISVSTGMTLSTLKGLQNEWIETFDWEREQSSMNLFHHYTTTIEGQVIHFIHETSDDPNAIPIILLHGWPGSFLEMVPLIDLLTSKGQASERFRNTTFNVVVPSLPGFGFSSPTPENWSSSDTARVFNTLMSQILGYGTYAVHGSDWGAFVAYNMYDKYNTTVRALHLNFLPFFPLDFDQLSTSNITLQPEEIYSEQRFHDWTQSGNGYFIEMTTKPDTIGYALYDNPMGQLAWLGEKFIEWSDPRQGTKPSLLTHHEILRHVSLYYLTRTLVSSAYMYNQNKGAFATEYTMAKTNAPMLYSSFKHNNGFWPKALVEKVGNLVYYKFQEFGGHFPGLDNPPALASDIRHIGDYW